MTSPLLKHPAFIAIMAITAVGWLIYLTMMIFEHRAVLKEMGRL